MIDNNRQAVYEIAVKQKPGGGSKSLDEDQIIRV
jgi:hypothetical protein